MSLIFDGAAAALIGLARFISDTRAAQRSASAGARIMMGVRPTLSGRWPLAGDPAVSMRPPSGVVTKPVNAGIFCCVIA